MVSMMPTMAQSTGRSSRPRARRAVLPLTTSTSSPMPAPTQRAAARAGVLDYLGAALEQMEEYRPDAVILPLNQQIGAPCQPVVQEGDQVTEGQLVAKCPDGKLGANLHASIAGTVVWTEGAIAIQERRS